ncbi:hypothetical protein EYY33_07410 [Escherichia coli]|nr:hypothetical protein [Escherichia coli]MDN1794557.1 hypothetical protein [Escherichia coli]MDN1829377.1 hypothetical protein [Escherichia coli]TII46220.1 hypothetical protein EYY33_07410 [Escherichia coli]TIJ21594.1 hypothetical protein EYY13_13085 [Escherichia coli]
MVIIRSLEHDVAQAAVLGLKVVNKRTCLTSRFFYFLRSAFQIISGMNICHRRIITCSVRLLLCYTPLNWQN